MAIAAVNFCELRDCCGEFLPIFSSLLPSAEMPVTIVWDVRVTATSGSG
jgi:hypothetical protein